MPHARQLLKETHNKPNVAQNKLCHNMQDVEATKVSRYLVAPLVKQLLVPH